MKPAKRLGIARHWLHLGGEAQLAEGTAQRRLVMADHVPGSGLSKAAAEKREVGRGANASLSDCESM